MSNVTYVTEWMNKPTNQPTNQPTPREIETTFVGFEYEECSLVNNGDIAAYHRRTSAFKLFIAAQCVFVSRICDKHALCILLLS